MTKTAPICDCILSHNGFGICGRICDCEDRSRKSVTNPTADPVQVNVTQTDDGVWMWDVLYEKEDAGLSQDGRCDSLDEALRCVNSAIENGRTEQ